MRAWKIYKVKDDAIIAPTTTLKCCFCLQELLLHDFRPLHRKKDQDDFYHCDIHMKCPKCSFFITFGVPITEEEYNNLASSNLHNKILIKYYEDEERIKKRLKIYNYW